MWWLDGHYRPGRDSPADPFTGETSALSRCGVSHSVGGGAQYVEVISIVKQVKQHVIRHCHLPLSVPPSVSDLSGECPVSHHFVVMKWNSSADQIITFYFKILTFNGFLWVKLRIFASGQVKQNNSGFRFLIIFSFPSKLFGRKVRDKPPATPRQSFILLLRVADPPVPPWQHCIVIVNTPLTSSRPTKVFPFSFSTIELI